MVLSLLTDYMYFALPSALGNEMKTMCCVQTIISKFMDGTEWWSIFCKLWLGLKNPSKAQSWGVAREDCGTNAAGCRDSTSPAWPLCLSSQGQNVPKVPNCLFWQILCLGPKTESWEALGIEVGCATWKKVVEEGITCFGQCCRIRKFKDVTCGGDHSLLLSARGTWGKNQVFVPMSQLNAPYNFFFSAHAFSQTNT